MNVLMTMLLAVVLAGADAKADDDAKLLTGNWQPVQGEVGGQKLPEDVLKNLSLSMTDGKYTVITPDVTDKGTYAIDPAKKPKTMDIDSAEGPNKGKKFLAIYELDKDKLKVCYDLSTNGRPTEFDTADHEAWLLIVYERKK